MMSSRKTNVRILVLAGLLAAVAAAMSWLENFIPIQVIVPIPGLKFGLANIVTIFAIFFLSKKQTFAIVAVRCLLGALLGGGFSAFAFSLTGALFAAAVMMAVKVGYDKNFSIYGISLAGAAAFNIAQVIVASIILQDTSIFFYLPILLAGGIATGILTAVISDMVLKKISSTKIIESYLKT